MQVPLGQYTVIQTEAMNEAERSEYCRKHGSFPEQIEAWKAGFEASAPTEAAPSSRSDLAAERKKSRALEKEPFEHRRAFYFLAFLRV